MERDITLGTRTELSSDIAQALWAAMQDDDGLAEDYVEYAVLHALTHLRNQGFHQMLERDRRERFLLRLEDARDRLDGEADEQARRWMTYLEPPF